MDKKREDMKRKIGVIVGSLRKDAFTKSIANYLLQQEVEGMELELVDISHLQLYNQDLDNADIKEYNDFKEKIASLDGFIFITPEHNRSYPASLKNAIDIASRPMTANRWGLKPGAVISSSIGSLGGYAAHTHLKQVLTFLGTRLMPGPETCLAFIQNSVKDGELVAEDTQSFLNNFLGSFTEWVKKVAN